MRGGGLGSAAFPNRPRQASGGLLAIARVRRRKRLARSGAASSARRGHNVTLKISRARCRRQFRRVAAASVSSLFWLRAARARPRFDSGCSRASDRSVTAQGRRRHDNPAALTRALNGWHPRVPAGTAALRPPPAGRARIHYLPRSCAAPAAAAGFPKSPASIAGGINPDPRARLAGRIIS